MATAKRELKPILVEIQQKQIVLTLSESEAESLRRIAYHVGGNPDFGPRADLNKIDDALASLDVGMSSTKPRLDAQCLYFSM